MYIGEKETEWDARESSPTFTNEPIAIEDLPPIVPMVHEVLIRNQVMFLNPPAEKAREHLVQQLQARIAIIADLNRIQSSRFHVGMQDTNLEKSRCTFRGLLVKLQESAGSTGQEPSSCGVLLRAYGLIEDRVGKIGEYVGRWLQYQALWDMQTDSIYVRLREDLGQWQQLLVEIKRARQTFDTHETSKAFGPIVINYAQVQTKVNLKYDQLHKDLLGKFGSKLGARINEFYTVVSKGRVDLESQSIETASTGEAVTFITLLQELKRKIATWSGDMEVFRGSQKVLERQRYAFPDDWRHTDMVEGEWQAFNEILTRKDQAVQGHLAPLQMKVVEEDRLLERRVADLLTDWDKNKPIGGDISPDQATNTLAIFESRFTRLKEEQDMLAKAKHALDLDSRVDERVVPRLEELRDLKSSWLELSLVWTNIAELKAVPWSAVVPRQIRVKLDDLLQQLKNLPSRVRSYASYEFTLLSVNSYLKANVHITNLKSESLKERHWKTLMKDLKVNWQLSDLNLGTVWAVDLAKHANAVNDVMKIAQGENALEEYMKQVREEWGSFELELVDYQRKTKLIKSWDDLFNKCKEHLNGLAAMKLSPYYKVFEDDAMGWDDKLSRTHALFDVWMDVQRRWVYLEGLFTGSAEIKHLLPGESSRFQSISSEFLGLMKKVAKNPLVIEVIQIAGVQRSMERQAELLEKVQKALGEYLETERSSFPRFYFVGDEDLLDIIGLYVLYIYIYIYI